jgi:glycosyltransferase involved in cell wall biosynthesis
MVVQSYYPFDVRVRRETEALVEQGCSVDVICRQQGFEPRLESMGAVTVHRLALGEKKWGLFTQLFEYVAFAFLAFLKVTQLHIRHRFDVVQVHNLPDFLVFSALVPRLTGSRIILDIHDLMPEFFCSRYKKSLNSFGVSLVRWQESLSCRFAHRVITVTELWKETLIQRGVPKDKCFVVMNLADPAYFERSSRNSRDSFPRSEAFRLIYHGTLAHRYGLDLLLKALQQVKNEIPNVYLRIHGRGPFTETVQTMVGELGLENHVEITLDFLSPSDLSSLIRSFDLGVVPYRRDVFTDGILPTKLLEYVALGIPALVAKTDVISRYFDDNAVEFFESEDVGDLARHIVHLYRDKERRKQLVSNSGEFNTVYSWPRQKDAYVRFVEQVACS